MKTKEVKGPSQRQLRVSEEIRHVLANMLMQDNLFISGLKAPYLMITEVKISPDLSSAIALVRSVGDLDTEEQVALLNKHKGVFRFRIGKEIRLRIVPEIAFKNDDAFEEAAHLTDLLNSPRVRADVEKPREEGEEVSDVC